MEGEGTPFRRVSLLPPILPHPPRTSPNSTRPCRVKIWFALFGAGALGGSFCRLGGADLLQSAASRSFCGWDAVRRYALHECRDSACWRPCGVRLRGGSSFHRLIFDIHAAPLRMTQWADCCVGDTILFRQSNLATNRLYHTKQHTLCVILSGAAQRCNTER